MSLSLDIAMGVLLKMESKGYLFKLESTCYEGKYLATFSKNDQSFSSVGSVPLAIHEAALGILETVESTREK